MRIFAISIIVLSFAALARQTFGQELSGIGVALRRSGDDLVVRGVLPDSPTAANKAIHPGDKIIAVGQGGDPPVKVAGLKLEEAVRLIRGPKGTVICFTVVPSAKDDSEAQVVRLVRGGLNVPVRPEMGSTVCSLRSVCSASP